MLKYGCFLRTILRSISVCSIFINNYIVAFMFFFLNNIEHFFWNDCRMRIVQFINLTFFAAYINNRNTYVFFITQNFFYRMFWPVLFSCRSVVIKPFSHYQLCTFVNRLTLSTCGITLIHINIRAQFGAFVIFCTPEYELQKVAPFRRTYLIIISIAFCLDIP